MVQLLLHLHKQEGQSTGTWDGVQDTANRRARRKMVNRVARRSLCLLVPCSVKSINKECRNGRMS